MSENARDSGLVRAVGPWALAASIVSMIIGAGIFAVPGALAAAAGRAAPLAFLACGVAIGAVAICFAEGGSRIPTSGGVYGYIDAAFGPLAGYVAGTMLWVGDVLACGGISAALADVVVSTMPRTVAAPARAAAIVCVVGAIALVNFGGAAKAARFVSIATALKLIPLAIFVVAGITAIHGSNFDQTLPVSTGGLGRALILAFFAFTGMEAALSVSGEVAQPNRTIPRAIAIAIVLVTIVYVAIQVVAQGILGSSLANSTVPLAEAMAQINPVLRTLMLAGAAVSMLGWLGSDLLGSPRVLFAFARDGLLPRALGKVDPRSHVPRTAIATYAVLAIILALTGSFTELAVLATLAVAPLYIGGCAGAWLLARRGVALAGAPLNFRWLGAAAIIGTASMVALIAMASAQEILGLAALTGVSALVYLTQTKLRSAAQRS